MENELSAETLARLAGIDDGLALVWLHTLEQVGHVKPEYRWYCPKTGALLCTTDSVNDIPDEVECRHCPASHKAESECHLSLVFLPKTSTTAHAVENTGRTRDAAS